jgi:hypothetical protein
MYTSRYGPPPFLLPYLETDQCANVPTRLHCIFPASNPSTDFPLDFPVNPNVIDPNLGGSVSGPRIVSEWGSFIFQHHDAEKAAGAVVSCQRRLFPKQGE